MDRTLFAPEILQEIDTHNGKLRLQEAQTRTNIEIRGVPEDAVLIKLDLESPPAFKRKSAYLGTNYRHIHKGCDYALICPSNRRILLFELKSDRPKGYIDQFRISQIFLDYCRQIWAYIQGTDEPSAFQFVFVLFSSTNRHRNQPLKGV